MLTSVAKTSEFENQSEISNKSKNRPRVHGKFIFVGDEKLYLRGVTYGTFGVENNSEYNPEKVKIDFALMKQNGVNTVRLYTVPPRWLLDLASENGLFVMVGLPWEQHINFLDDAKITDSIAARIRENVLSCANHSAVLCFAIGNEIPAPIVRWFGHRKIEKFLHRLYKIVKSEDSEALVTYVNFPTTEYLNLPFIDFICFNVYLESQEKLENYLSRLQNLAGDKPLVMAEIGLDSLRNGVEKQAETLDWQIRTAFASGVAGIFVFAWTDEWHRGGLEIEDWDFGLTTRNREPKPALEAVKKAFAEIPFPPDMKFPKISVAVCSYNGSRTIRDCFDGLLAVDYPDFEVIVVNDGSTDSVPQIAAEYPQFKLISTPNMGLSSARNTALEHATGEIIAYTDDDARPDPQWLKYLAATFTSTTHAGIGGPNIAPLDDGEIAECVANAPGGPIHVLISDTEAEHIPGCNMAFRCDALREIGGFDVQYRNAGDDVDVCWRIQEKGWTLGFSPAAMVWHHRRNSVRDYWKQQKGYGKAEALLEGKWADKYNAVGHLTWQGRLYGKGFTQALNIKRGRIYQGVWGSALFQSVYQPATGLLESLPLMPEWYLIIGLLTALTALGFFWKPMLYLLPILMIAVFAPIGQAILSGFKATFQTKAKSQFARIQRRTITAFLHLLQPLARLYGRLNHGLTPWRKRGVTSFSFPHRKDFIYWTENWLDSSDRLQKIETALQKKGAIVQRNTDFEGHFDLFVRGGMFGGTRILKLAEEHGQGKQLVRVRVFPKVQSLAIAIIITLIALSIFADLEGQFIASLTIGVLALMFALRSLLETGYTKHAVLQAIGEIQVAENGVILSKNNLAIDSQNVEVEPETESA